MVSVIPLLCYELPLSGKLHIFTAVMLILWNWYFCLRLSQSQRVGFTLQIYSSSHMFSSVLCCYVDEFWQLMFGSSIDSHFWTASLAPLASIMDWFEMPTVSGGLSQRQLLHASQGCIQHLSHERDSQSLNVHRAAPRVRGSILSWCN